MYIFTFNITFLVICKMKKLLFLLSIFYISSTYSQDSIGSTHSSAFFDNVYLNCNYSPLFITNVPDNAFNHQKFELGGTFLHSFSSKYQLGLLVNLVDFTNYKDNTSYSNISPPEYDPRNFDNSFSRLEHEIGIKNRFYFTKDFFADISLGYTFCSMYRTVSETQYFYRKVDYQYLPILNNFAPSTFIDYSLGFKWITIRYSIKNTKAGFGMENYVGIGLQFKL